MRKKLTKTATRLKNERWEKTIEVLRAAMRLGFSTKTDLAEKANIKLWELNEIFTFDPEVYAEFCLMRKTLVDTAADNLQDILHDKAHPQNFQATKYILQTYKSDLDTNLETKKADEVDLVLKGGGNVSPIRITFGKSDKK